MTRRVVSTLIYEPTANAVNLTNNGDILLVTPTGVLWGGDSGGRYGINSLGSNQLIQMNGAAMGEYGVNFDGTANRLVVGQTGVIVGELDGVYLGTGANVVVNHGEITGRDFGINSDGAMRIENYGRITGGLAAIAGSGVADVVRNAGLASGSVQLFGGDDTYDGTGGTVESFIDLGSGNDTAIGGGGADLFFDGTGADDIFAGAGNDRITLEIDQIADTFDGGSGVDTLTFTRSAEAIRLDLSRGTLTSSRFGSDEISGFERIVCGSGNDRVIGDDLANTLYGQAGNDSLFGLGGNDVLYGGVDGNANYLSGGDGNDRVWGGDGPDRMLGSAGNDIFYGRYDVDLMSGGDGADRFLYRDVEELFTISGTGGERITDFRPGEDVIDLSAIDWNATGVDDAFVFRGTAALTGPGQVAIRQADGATYVDISWQTAGAADSIQLYGLLTLTSGDFIL